MDIVANTNSSAAGCSTLDEINCLLDQLSRLARTEKRPDAFYSQLLETATEAIGAVAAAIWLPISGRELAPLRRYRLEFVHGEPRHRAIAAESNRYRAVLSSGHAAGFGAEPKAGVLCAVLTCPLKDAASAVGVLTIYLPADTPAVARERLLEFAQAIAAIALEYELYQQVAHVEDAVRLARHVEAFSLRVHQLWNPSDAAYELANEGRRLIGCDRVSVLSLPGWRWRVEAVSGVDRIASRSSEVERLRSLVGRVAESRQPLIYTGETGDLSPQVEAALSCYLDGAASRELAVVPAVPAISAESTAPAEYVVAIVAEQFSGRLPLEWIPH